MNYISYNDLISDTKKLAQTLPNQYAGIISIPRSGNIPANILALHFNIPVYTINEFTSGIPVDKYTQRYSGESHNDKQTFIVIDDSVNSGSRIRQCKQELSKFPKSKFKFKYGAIYTSAKGIPEIDFYVKKVNTPRIFEWNIFNHYILQYSYLDIDGVICPDPTYGIDEVIDEKKYIDFISKSIPMNIIKSPILGFITSRMEKYRDVTEEWLHKHDFNYKELHMCQYKDAIERRTKKRYGKDKASIYSNSNAMLMIESSEIQAREIFQLTNKPVYCTDINLLYKV